MLHDNINDSNKGDCTEQLRRDLKNQANLKRHRWANLVKIYNDLLEYFHTRYDPDRKD
jgi:hypothetical protein